MNEGRVGIWFVGVRGGVATTTILGLAALRAGRTESWGLVSELPRFAGLDLLAWDRWVVGGHEIRSTRLFDEAMQLANVSRAVDRDLVRSLEAELDEVDRRVRPGVLVNVGSTIERLADDALRNVAETPAEAVRRIRKDLEEFAAAEKLERVIVVNVASTEPAPDLERLPTTWEELAPELEKRDCPISASSLYAIAALDLGFPFVNFTPSPGSALPAIDDLAVLRGTCHMGHDGKTGETLLKSALAPMFAARNLEIMSWVGHNIFGNMDGVVLNDPENKRTKVRSKDRLLGEILGYHPQTHISIEYIRSLGDWKTAWDHIHFRGFLGTPMVMTFTWQGCDSLLAAPLVLDLVRFTERAARAGETGLLVWLASFFKSPLGVTENDFVRQFQMLESWTDAQVESGSGS
ncbi:MAG TPA: inositol-3-phosphate synthase [Pirellulaceae bacterium]|nr:inositol-3-phosphate synthase [Pirellulaceae bacterium]